MKNHSFFSLLGVSITLLVALALPLQSFGFAAAVIHPTDSIDSLGTTFDDNGYVSINPNLTPIISNEEYSHTTHIEADKNAGRIRGYSGYNLENARTITRTENLIDTIAGSEDELALVSNVTGIISYEADVAGPVGVGTSFATVFIDVEGSFNYDIGAPSLGLLGGVSIGIIPGGNVFDSESFVLGGVFTNFDEQAWMADSSLVSTRETLQVFDAFGGVLLNPTIAGVTTDVQFISMDPEALQMRLSLTVPIRDGDVWSLQGLAGASATHAFVDDFRELEVGEMGDVAAASGYVDFLGTASLGIELPEGFTLAGEGAPPLSIISSPNPIPIPGAVWLFGTGLFGLIGVTRRKKVTIEH